MKAFICAVLLALLYLSDTSLGKEASPKIQVYSRTPGEYGKPNTLICHVSQFHPPEISIELLKNQKVIPDSKQTDLAFEENWHYHLTKHVPFTPNKGDEYACNVTHLGKSKIYIWEADL